MKESDSVAPISTIKFGIFAGSLAGLGYALGVWGIDSVMLSMSHGMVPFLKLVLGGIVCVLLGALAGWLSRRFVNVMANVVLWASAGIIMDRFALFLNFPGMQAILLRQYPEFSTLIDYSIDTGVSTRGTLMLIITVLACGIIGLFFNSMVDGIVSNTGVRAAFSIIILIGLFFAVAYNATAMNTNRMRDAIVTVDESMQFAIDHTGENLSTQVKLQMGLFGLKKVEPFLNSPYRLITASYDKMLLYIQVLVHFEDQNAICPVINGSLGTCNLVE